MRYTKLALLTFGAGLVLGLVILAFGIDPLARIASGLMALGLVATPVGLAADAWAALKAVRRPRRRARPAPRRAVASSPRRASRARKPAAPKR